MNRLLIADDEQDERAGIRFLLNRCGFEFEIEEAVDGKEALEKLKEKPADILLTDVKMPFMNGIELATEARTLLPGIQIIFFSGYDDFEYVRRALSLQAVDYILKPVNPAEFEKVIALVVDRIRQEEEADSHFRRFHQTYVLSRLLNQVPLDKLRQEYKAEQLTFLEQYRRLILMEFDGDFFGKDVVDVQAFAGMFGEMLSCDYDFLDVNPSQGVFYLENSPREDGFWREAARCIHLAVKKEYNRTCYLAVSREIGGPEQIGRAYAEAENCLEERFFYRDAYVYPLDMAKQQETGAAVNDGDVLQMIEKDLTCRDGYSLHKDMEILLDKCRNNGFQSYIYTRFVCSSLLKSLFSHIPDSESRLADMVERIYSKGSFTELEGMLWQVEAELEAQFKQGEDAPKHTISLVEQYIREHYEEVLSLDILAEKVYLTPHYLSSIFIQEKGIGISKYIKNVRMEKARELLLGTNMKISDICEKVGYTNLSYFCRSFRNEYGMTPDQYRR